MHRLTHWQSPCLQFVKQVTDAALVDCSGAVIGRARCGESVALLRRLYDSPGAACVARTERTPSFEACCVAWCRTWHVSFLQRRLAPTSHPMRSRRTLVQRRRRLNRLGPQQSSASGKRGCINAERRCEVEWQLWLKFFLSWHPVMPIGSQCSTRSRWTSCIVGKA